ncbi:type VII secretion protein EccE [Nocardia colli]|uniref:Type VII secretion protein EccE n=1 Tax=Nocardia colli TaxID=2545717 RepID=A0A5N0E2F8_9NOCA|nr:type VII secretion protein EccE [Nocardia colli]
MRLGFDRGPLAAVVLVGSLISAGTSARLPWWVGPLVSAALIVAVTVEVNGRTAWRWTLDWTRYRSGHAARAGARAEALPEAAEIRVPAGECGVRAIGSTLVAMIQLTPNLDLPTVIADNVIYTEDTVSVAALLPLLDHYGIAVDIDIVTTGQRTRPSGNYSMLYDQIVGRHAIVGSRVTWLVVRLDQERNLAALARRGPCAVSAPAALATAAHRIAGRLRERGILAYPLPPAAMRDAVRLLHEGVELADLAEKWECLESSAPGRCVTTYAVDWSLIGDNGLADCWASSRGHTTLVVSLSRRGPSALVRYVGPAGQPRPRYLRPLNGRQSAALLTSLSAGEPVSVFAGHRPRGRAGTDRLLADLLIPIGPNGQILGSLASQPRHALALPLFDPARYNPRRRTVEVCAKLPVAQQILLRAMAVGAEVEIHTIRPNSWRTLVAAVGDTRSLRLVSDHPSIDPSVATVAVFDHVSPQVSTAQTTVIISDPGGPHSGSVDLVIDQVSATAVDINMPMRTVRVDLIEPRGESRYFDAPADPPVVPAPINVYATTPHRNGRSFNTQVER